MRSWMKWTMRLSLAAGTTTARCGGRSGSSGPGSPMRWSKPSRIAKRCQLSRTSAGDEIGTSSLDARSRSLALVMRALQYLSACCWSAKMRSSHLLCMPTYENGGFSSQVERGIFSTFRCEYIPVRSTPERCRSPRRVYCRLAASMRRVIECGTTKKLSGAVGAGSYVPPF